MNMDKNGCLENESLLIQTEERGAELVRIYDKECGREVLWTGAKPFWSYHSPVLFPIVGKVTADQYRYRGKTYTLPQHGFARQSFFSREADALWTEEVGGKSSSPSVSYVLKASDATRENYPFDFCLHVGYRLEGRCVRVLWKVENPSDTEPLYFSIGAHPAFCTPPTAENKKEDCTVRFEDDPRPEYILFDTEKCVALPDTSYTMETENGHLKLVPHLFDVNTFIFDGGQIENISLCAPDGRPYVTVRCQGFPFFGLWTQSDEAPFVCLEPWYGRLDDIGFEGELPEKRGIIGLEPGGSWSAQYMIETYAL